MSGLLIDNKYEVLDTIGVGGFGTVYAAIQQQFERKVAVKVLKTTLLHEADGLARFEREAKSISGLKHKNLVAFYGYGAWQQAPYMVMEFIDGVSLQSVLEQGKAVEPLRALRLIRQLFEGLACAHAGGVVHRDLKPSNILIAKEADGAECVKIIDFGLARLMPGYGIPGQKLTETGYALGTCHYMPPEQALGTAVDQRADIYSAGCVLYQMLTGKLPFDAENNVAVMFQHIRNEPAPLRESLTPPAPIECIQIFVDNCLAKNAADRYQNARDAIADIDAILTGKFAGVTPLTVRARNTQQRLPTLSPPRMLAVCASIAIVGLVVFGAYYGSFSPPQNRDHIAMAEAFLADYRHFDRWPNEDVYRHLEELYDDKPSLDRLTRARRCDLLGILLARRGDVPWSEAQALKRLPLAAELAGQILAANDRNPDSEGILALSRLRDHPLASLPPSERSRTLSLICIYLSRALRADRLSADGKKWCRECLSDASWTEHEGAYPGAAAQAAFLFATLAPSASAYESMLQRVIEITSTTDFHHLESEYWLGRLAASRNQYDLCDKLAQSLSRGAENSPDAAEFAGKRNQLTSLVALSRGDFDRIEHLWNAPNAQSDDPQDATRSEWLARVAIHRGEYARAYELLLPCLKNKRGTWVTELVAAVALDKAGKREEALRHLRSKHAGNFWSVPATMVESVYDLRQIPDLVPPEWIETRQGA